MRISNIIPHGLHSFDCMMSAEVKLSWKYSTVKYISTRIMHACTVYYYRAFDIYVILWNAA